MARRKFLCQQENCRRVQGIGQAENCTLPQIALAWVAAQGMISIPGTTKPDRLTENFNSRDVDLTEEDTQNMRKLVDVLRPQGDRYNEIAAKAIGN